MNFHYVTLILILWMRLTLQRSNYNSPSYMAAVVEYSPVLELIDGEEDPDAENTKNYLKIIDKAASYGIDVIVFPESTLAISPLINKIINRSKPASYIPDPAAKIIPCDDKSELYKNSFKNMSCAARDHQIYIVVNHREKVNCVSGSRGCPADGLLIYNTNVAFDRDGRVIARYRKFNLFFEDGVNITESIPTTFKTDFGVTFGTMICFDVFFPRPSSNLIYDLGITDILYSSHWYDKPPFFFSVEIQAAWAYATDVNFMASGHSNPILTSGGSGIYLGRQGYIDIVSHNKRSNVLMVAEIPKVIKGKRTQNINRDNVHVYEFTKEEISTSESNEGRNWFYLPPNLSDFSLELIDLNEKEQTKTVCNRGLCCEFKLTIDFDRDSIKNSSNYYRYRFAVLNGTHSFPGTDTIGVKSCGVVACVNDVKDGCGHLFDDYKSAITPTTFTSLEISTPHIVDANAFFGPVTFTQKMVPLNVADFSFEYSRTSKIRKSHMKLKVPSLFQKFSDRNAIDVIYSMNQSKVLYFSPDVVLSSQAILPTEACLVEKYKPSYVPIEIDRKIYIFQ